MPSRRVRASTVGDVPGDPARLDADFAQLARRRDAEPAKVQARRRGGRTADRRYPARVERIGCLRQERAKVRAKAGRGDDRVIRFSPAVGEFHGSRMEPANVRPNRNSAAADRRHGAYIDEGYTLSFAEVGDWSPLRTAETKPR